MSETDRHFKRQTVDYTDRLLIEKDKLLRDIQKFDERDRQKDR